MFLYKPSRASDTLAAGDRLFHRGPDPFRLRWSTLLRNCYPKSFGRTEA